MSALGSGVDYENILGQGSCLYRDVEMSKFGDDLVYCDLSSYDSIRYLPRLPNSVGKRMG